MTKKLLFLSSCTILPCTAQTTYDWAFTPDVDVFGDNEFPAIIGDYTYSALVDGGVDNSNNPLPSTYNPMDAATGIHNADASSRGGWYGDGDALTMVLSPNIRGYFMGSDPTSTFDLSTPGSSVTIRSANYFKRSILARDYLNMSSGVNVHMYRLGLTNGISHGSAGNQSLILAADAQSIGDFAFGGPQYIPMQVNFDLLDQTGLDIVPDNVWDQTPLTTVASGIAINSTLNGREWPQADPQGQSNLYFTTMTFTNIGDGKLGVGTSVIGAYAYDTNYDGVDVSLLSQAEEFTRPTSIVSEYVEVDHPFGDLSDLRPAFGIANESPSDLVLSSGANFTWDDSFPNVTPPIPEPSSLSLLMLAMIGLASHRRR